MFNQIGPPSRTDFYGDKQTNKLTENRYISKIIIRISCLWLQYNLIIYICDTGTTSIILVTQYYGSYYLYVDTVIRLVNCFWCFLEGHTCNQRSVAVSCPLTTKCSIYNKWNGIMMLAACAQTARADLCNFATGS